MNEKQIKFTQDLFECYSDGKNEKLLLPKAKLDDIIDRLKLIRTDGVTKKSREDYYIQLRYDVLNIGDISKLIKKQQSPSEAVKYFVSIEETFDIIKRTHIALNHAGRDKMLKELKKKYVNITETAIRLYKSLCEEWQLRQRNPNKRVVVRPILSKDFNCRGQVDLLDMQSMPDGQYRFIMNYQDHLTKFCVVEALSSKRAAEVAYKLLNSVFLVFGAPHILQSDNGREFTAAVITELKQLWPELVIVHGRPRHPQSQGSVERSNADIHDMLVSWMRDNETTRWSTGIKFVQFQKNRRQHEGIKRSPYEAMFGCPPKVGLTTSSLPNEILDMLSQEEELECHFSNQTRNINPDQYIDSLVNALLDSDSDVIQAEDMTSFSASDEVVLHVNLTDLTQSNSMSNVSSATADITPGVSSADVTPGVSSDITSGISSAGMSSGATSGVFSDVTSGDFSTDVTSGVSSGVTSGVSYDSDITSGISSDITSGVSSGATSDDFSADVTSGVSSGVTSGVSLDSDVTSGISSDITSGVSSGATSDDLSAEVTSGVSSGVTSGVSSAGVTRKS